MTVKFLGSPTLSMILQRYLTWLLKFSTLELKMYSRLCLRRYSRLMMRQALEKGFSSNHSDFSCRIDFKLRFAPLTDRMKSREFISKCDSTLCTQGQFFWMKIRIAFPQFLGMFLDYFPREQTPPLQGCSSGIQEAQSEWGSLSIVFLVILFFIPSISTSNPEGDGLILLEASKQASESLAVVSWASVVSREGFSMRWMRPLLIGSCWVSVWERV